MNLTSAKVETTATNRGQRVFRQLDVQWDAERGVELNFIAASEGKPAQHRIFVRDTTNRFEGQIGVSLRPELITRFVDDEIARLHRLAPLGVKIVSVDGKRVVSLDESIAQAKREINTFFTLEERQGVGSFSDLHDLCDANTLGFLCDEDVVFADSQGPITAETDPTRDRWVTFGNDVQTAVDTWIKGGHHRETP